MRSISCSQKDLILLDFSLVRVGLRHGLFDSVTERALEPSGWAAVSSVGARRLPIGRKLPRALTLWRFPILVLPTLISYARAFKPCASYI